MLFTLSAFLTVSESRNRTGQSWCLKWRCQGLCIHHLSILWPPWPLSFHPTFSFFFLCLPFLPTLGGESQHGGPGDTSHDSSCQPLLSVTLTDWHPFILPLGISTIIGITTSVHILTFYWICCTLQCLMVDMRSLPGCRLNLIYKKKSPQRENSTDPSFARSHLDPPEETSSGVQFQRRDVWSGEGLD